MSQPDFDTIKTNWDTYEKLCNKAVKHGMGDLIETLGERLITTPYSTHEKDGGCYAGGLVENALETTSKMRKLAASFDLDINTGSILKVGLLHEIGKVGTLENDLFVEQDSSWHREKLGQFYKYNENVSKSTIPDRTLCLLQHFGITLTNDEFYAIRLSQGSHLEENRFYVGTEPDLAKCLQMAKRL